MTRQQIDEMNKLIDVHEDTAMRYAQTSCSTRDKLLPLFLQARHDLEAFIIKAFEKK